MCACVCVCVCVCTKMKSSLLFAHLQELYEEEQRKKEKLADELEKAVRTTDKM